MGSMGDVYEYRIPDDIKDRIPDYFFGAFGGELVGVFGADALIRAEDGLSNVDYSAGTFGWYTAFKAVCLRLQMGWLLEYYDELTWYDSDQFDGEMVEALFEYFGDESKNKTYYSYLLNKDKNTAQ